MTLWSVLFGVRNIIVVFQTMIIKMVTNKRYRLKVAAITYGIFSSRHYLGEFTEPIEFNIGGRFDYLT